MIPTSPTPPEGLPPNAPVAKLEKHPLRFGIIGKTHLVSELRKIVNEEPGLTDTYKQFVNSELDQVKTNAATVDLHVVDHHNGDVSVSLHIKQVKLG